jgi:hypothetical protein
MPPNLPASAGSRFSLSVGLTPSRDHRSQDKRGRYTSAGKAGQASLERREIFFAGGFSIDEVART